MISPQRLPSLPMGPLRKMFRRKHGASLALAGAGAIAAAHALAAGPANLTVRAVASRRGTSARHLAGQLDANRVPVDRLPAGADVLVVATPPDTHEHLLLQGLAAGARVLVEKPLTTTLASADRMVAAAAGPGAPRTLVAENLLASPYWRAALEHRQQGVPLTHLSAQVVQPPPNWGHFLEPLESGGVVFDLGPHPISLVIGLADEPVVAVSGRLSSTRSDGADDEARIEIRFASGLVAGIELSWTSPVTQWSLQAATPDRVIRLEITPETVLEVDGETVPVPTRYEVVDPRLESLGYVDQLVMIASDPVDPPGSTGPGTGRGQSLEDARHVLEVICAAYLSAGRDGEEIPLPFRGDRDLTPMQLWRDAAT